MISIRHEPMRLTIKGHAGSAEKGRDLICAAVSTLTYTLVAELYELEEMGLVDMGDIQVRLEPGDAEVSFGSRSWAVEGAYRTVCAGFKMLAKQYPEYVEFV